MRYLTHILPDTVSCDTEKIQPRFIGDTFAIRDEQIVELGDLVDEPLCKVAKAACGRKRKGLRCISCPLAFNVSGFAVRFVSCI
jgi:hypothetical protein